ncbi:MAG: AmmeMemoRadiSam system radical SAM enzyme [Methanomassiliicoccales archaeon]
MQKTHRKAIKREKSISLYRPFESVKEAALYRVEENKIRCTACARYCKLADGQTGLCGIRQNVSGRLMLLAYGRIIAGHIDPIEKKPLVHFNPGTSIFSVATTGCNWLCQYCQNFDISQRRRIEGQKMDPAEIVEMAVRYGADGIAYTYNEPTIFLEFARDIGLEAHRRGLFNIFVSNGYGTPEAAEMAATFLDAITVDFKGNASPAFIRKYIGVPSAEPIFHYVPALASKGVHVEFTDLIVPEVGDDLEAARKLCGWILANFGAEAPIHFLRFHPDYKMMNIPQTPVRTLEEHCKIAKEVGLRFVYIGNVPGHPLENTYCPNCGKVVVGRYGFDITSWKLDASNRCLSCGYQLPIHGRLSAHHSRNRFLPVIN